MDGAIEPGGRFGQLAIERELGRGAFAVVYLARDTLLDRPVALKVLAASRLSRSGEERSTLLEEARMVARLGSPHIVSVYRAHDLGEAGLALEMEYLPGGSLADLLARQGALPVERALQHARTLLLALGAAHEQGIVHRDVKPENVLLTAQGEVKLADFGLGRQTGEASLSLDHAHRLVGSPLYMAPEVVSGDHATPASDVWSVGVVLYEMLVGRRPFDAASLPALFYAIHHDEPEPLGPAFPAALVQAVSRCLTKSPSERTPLAGLLHELDALLAPQQAAPRAPAREPALPHVPPAGRQAELAVLDAAVEAAVAERGGAVLVLGHAGVGKSALLQETGRRARARGLRWVDVPLTPLGGLSRALLAAAKRLLTGGSTSLGTGHGISREKFGAAAPLLVSLLSGADAEQQGRQQLVWAMENLLRGLASEQPLAWCLEDAQFADADDLKILAELIRRVSGGRIATFVAYRSDDPLRSQEVPLATATLADLSRLEEVRTLDVGPLDAEGVEHLVAQHLEGAPVAAEIVERVQETAEGNPLFAIEMLRHLVATGEVERGGRGWTPGPRWRSTEPPQRLRDMVSARLAVLGEEDRGLLDAASVEGVAFDSEPLAAALEQNLLHVLRALQRLQRQHRLLVPLRHGFRFAHALFREVVYAELAPSLREALHRTFAEDLERRLPEQVDPERLGTHWLAAGDAERARPHLARAAETASHRTQNRRAMDLLVRAGLGPDEITPERARTYADVLLVAVHSVRDARGMPAAERILAALARAAENPPDELLALRTAVERSFLRLYSEGRDAADREGLERAVQRLAPSKALGRAHYVLGVLAKYEGDFERASAQLSRAEEIWGRLGLEAHCASAMDQRASVLMRTGRLAEAHALYGEASAASERTGRQLNAAVSRANQALVAVDMGRVEGMVAQFEVAARSMEASGSRDLATHTRAIAGGLLVASGELASGLAMLEASVRAARSSGFLPAVSEGSLGLAKALHAAGRARAAAEQIGATRAAAAQEGDEDVRLAVEAEALAQGIWQGTPAVVAVAEALSDEALRRCSRAGLAESLVPLAEAAFAPAGAGLMDLLLLRAATLEADPPRLAARYVSALLRGRAAWDGGSADVETLSAAGRLLAGDPALSSRLGARVLGALMLAEVDRREGRLAAHRKRVEEAAQAARSAQHAWWELLALTQLEKQGVVRGDASRRRDLLARLEAELQAEDARRCLVQAWVGGAS